MSTLSRMYRIPALGSGAVERLAREGGFAPKQIRTEYCLYVQSSSPLDVRAMSILRRRLAASYLPEGISEDSFLADCPTVIEVGPRLNFMTVASSTTTAVFNDCMIPEIERVERSTRIGIHETLSEEEVEVFLGSLFRQMFFDRMTQERYLVPLETFDSGRSRGELVWVPIISEGIDALRRFCAEAGISFDEQDMQDVYALFHDLEGRDATDAELRYLGNQWSEHCSHGYWKGQRIINGREAPMSLMAYARLPWERNPGNALIAFHDEGSSFAGLRPVEVLVPVSPGQPSALVPSSVYFHPVLTDESHCHPSKVCPREGAATGVARVRDNITVGRGAEMGCGHFGIIVGNLHIPGYEQPWEGAPWTPIGAVPSLEIATESRLGAWGFGNALGEPVPGGAGFHAFGVDPGDGHRSYVKPIIFTGGLSLLRAEHVEKIPPRQRRLLEKDGGPRLPVGLGGGFRSSTSAGVEDDLELAESHDFDSVQRGAPEMQQRGVRLTRACIERGESNPIEWAKDGGAGGDGTAISETAENCGVEVDMRRIPTGDPTMSPDVAINNESQEQQYHSVAPGEPAEFMVMAAQRERCPCNIIGEFDGNGRVVFRDDWAENERDRTPIDLPLAPVFGKRPRKTFEINSVAAERRPLVLPSRLTMAEVLDRVLRLPSVACKGWLTNHVDRSVSGRIAQQSCIGPYQLPASDYWVMANSFLDLIGTVATSAVRPHLGLVSGGASARMTIAEALISVSGAEISGLEDINCEVNWFSDAKADGEGVVIEETARALSETMIQLGIRQLGGKDSSSGSNLAMSPEGEVTKVKWPVTIFITLAAQMYDITRKVTPLIEEDTDVLVHIDLSPEYKPLGASALAQVFGQTGDDCADVNIEALANYFKKTQSLLRAGLVRSLHDISDGGLITALLEMAFVSGFGLDIETKGRFGWLRHHLSEVPGAVIGCKASEAQQLVKQYHDVGLRADIVAKVRRPHRSPQVCLIHNERLVHRSSMCSLRSAWMETSFQIDARDSNPKCIEEERRGTAAQIARPPYDLTFNPEPTPASVIRMKDRPKVAIIRAPGSNGDREMAGMFYEAGFEPHDIMTTDLIDGRASLDPFQAAAQVGGFAYQDEPMESGVGWAASVEENPRAWEQYRTFFFERQDTLSYHACNGTQTAAILGIAPDQSLPLEKRPRFLQNSSGMFESRYVTVRIENSPAIMFREMEGSILGIIVAHGEGRLYCHDQSVLEWILDNGLVPMTYVDHCGQTTEVYPFNPNGSPLGIAGLTTPDGRHVITMPHIERLWQLWQLPWAPESWKELVASPWLKPAQNMYKWCMEHRNS